MRPLYEVGGCRRRADGTQVSPLAASGREQAIMQEKEAAAGGSGTRDCRATRLSSECMWYLSRQAAVTIQLGRPRGSPPVEKNSDYLAAAAAAVAPRFSPPIGWPIGSKMQFGWRCARE